MLRNMRRHLRVWPIVAIALALPANQGRSEITVPNDTITAESAPLALAEISTEESIQETPFQVQCWQNGVKIIDEKDFFSIRLRNLIDRETLGIRGRDSNSGDVYIIPVNENSTCLIKSSF